MSSLMAAEEDNGLLQTSPLLFAGVQEHEDNHGRSPADEEGAENDLRDQEALGLCISHDFLPDVADA